MKKPGTLFIVSACSGAGKTSLVTALLEILDPTYAIARVITYTSRMPRAGERDGKEYHFITNQQFEKRIAEGFFAEWSGAYGAYYGTPRSIFAQIDDGKSYILIIDRAGAMAILQMYPQAVPLWIAVPSLTVLESRLRARATEPEDKIKYRLALAEKEMQQEVDQPLYSIYIMNDQFENALHALKNVIKTYVSA